MEGRYDTIVIVVIAVVLLLWLYYGLRSWLREPAPIVLRAIPINEEIDQEPAVEILEKAGYDVVGGKMRIPLTFELDNHEVYSRLFIDYVAMYNDLTYIVKTSRHRKPVEWNGPDVRDKWLPYLLLYPGCAGLLYVDTEEQTIRCITMVTNEED